MSDQFVACIAVEALTILEQLHRKGYVTVHSPDEVVIHIDIYKLE